MNTREIQKRVQKLCHEFKKEEWKIKPPKKYSLKALHTIIDHTYLKPDTNQSIVRKLCDEAIRYGFKSVCIPPYWVPYAKKMLEKSSPLVCSVIGFPFGNNTTNTKIFEIKETLQNGAKELDIVINNAMVIQKEYKKLFDELFIMSSAIKSANAISKLILETSLLDKKQIVDVAIIARLAQFHFIKTSTGFSKKGATLEDITLMKKVVGEDMKVKASGGIKDYNTAIQFVQAGANRIGTSSSVQIIVEEKKLNNSALLK